jgi:hypothetical protein
LGRRWLEATAILAAMAGLLPASCNRSGGPLPPACEGYQALGFRDGIESWAVRYDEALLRGGEISSERAARALAEWGVRTVISVIPTDREREFCWSYDRALVEYGRLGGDLRADHAMLEVVRTFKP